MTLRRDWLKRPLPELSVMFANVNTKIGGYKTTYDLSDDWISRVQLMCNSFNFAYTGVMQNRATATDLNDWFDTLLNGAPKGEIATAPPTFLPATMPPGAFIGLIDEFREMMRFFKANAAYKVKLPTAKI